MQDFFVSLFSMFVGEGWHLTLGLLFMIIVIFLPGGLMEGFNRIWNRLRGKNSDEAKSVVTANE